MTVVRMLSSPQSQATEQRMEAAAPERHANAGSVPRFEAQRNYDCVEFAQRPGLAKGNPKDHSSLPGNFIKNHAPKTRRPTPDLKTYTRAEEGRHKRTQVGWG